MKNEILETFFLSQLWDSAERVMCNRGLKRFVWLSKPSGAFFFCPDKWVFVLIDFVYRLLFDIK
ncbi:MAG: hypothetical protein QXE83_01050 [Archaeoglobaceae archaeon]